MSCFARKVVELSSPENDDLTQGVRDTLLLAIRSMVDNPSDVEVELLSDEDTEVFSVWVHPGDVGRLIGKNGQTVRALRVIANTSGRRAGRYFDLDIAGKDERS